MSLKFHSHRKQRGLALATADMTRILLVTFARTSMRALFLAYLSKAALEGGPGRQVTDALFASRRGRLA